MSFLSGNWTAINRNLTSPKRRQSESAISFGMPTSKRAKPAASESDVAETDITAGTRDVQVPVCRSLGVSSEPTNAMPSKYLDAASGTTHITQNQLDGQVDVDSIASKDNRAPGPDERPPFSPGAALFEKPTIRKCIAGHLTAHIKTVFRPFYRQGALRGYLAQPTVRWNAKFPGVDAQDIYDGREITENNIEMPELLVSKAFAKDYLDSFYSQNYFSFDDPLAARWFFKHMGGQFANLQNIQFEIYGGFDSTPATRCGLVSASWEELWCNLFCWLKGRQAFTYLHVVIKDIPSYSSYSTNVSREDLEERHVYIDRLLDDIAALRGIKKARLYDNTREYRLSRADLSRYELCMQQPQTKQQLAGCSDLRKMTFSEVLDHMRLKHSPQANTQLDVDQEYGSGTHQEAVVDERQLIGPQKQRRRGGQDGRKNKRKQNHQPSNSAPTSAPVHILPERPPVRQDPTQMKAQSGEMGNSKMNGYHHGQQPQSRQNSQTWNADQQTQWKGPSGYSADSPHSREIPDSQQAQNRSGSYIGQKGRPGFYGRKQHKFNNRKNWVSGNGGTANQELNDDMVKHWGRSLK